MSSCLGCIIDSIIPRDIKQDLATLSMVLYCPSSLSPVNEVTCKHLL